MPKSQAELFLKLKVLLEQCLIVDNFNREVDKSLKSYLEATDVNKWKKHNKLELRSKQKKSPVKAPHI